MKKERFDIEGMSCASCVRHIEKAVNKVSGVEEATVNLATEKMEVTYDPKTDPSTIVQAVSDAGYGAAPEKKN